MPIIQIGEPILFGVPSIRPLIGFPAGVAKIRLRPKDFVRVYIRTPEGIAEFVVKDSPDGWTPAHCLGVNKRL